MRKVAFAVLAMLGFMASEATADYTFPVFAGPYNVAAGTGFTLGVNDAGNSAGVTPDLYGSFTITADWVAGGGNPWSSEAEILVTTSAGSFEVDPPTSGGATNGDPTTLTFAGGLPGIYDPSVDGYLDLFMGQSFGGSDADWSNVTITLESFVAPPPPSTQATLTASGYASSDTFTDADYGSGEVTWVELVYDGVSPLTIDTEGTTGVSDTEIGLYDANGFLMGSDDDDGTGFLSAITFSGLDAGTYYIATSTWDTTFGAGFNVTTTGTASGPITINASTAIPEPTTMGTLALVCVGLFVRRRR